MRGAQIRLRPPLYNPQMNLSPRIGLQTDYTAPGEKAGQLGEQTGVR